MLGRPNELSQALAQSVIQRTRFLKHFWLLFAATAKQNKKLAFEILRYAILIGKYALRPLYHTEPASMRMLTALQNLSNSNEFQTPHTSDMNLKPLQTSETKTALMT